MGTDNYVLFKTFTTVYAQAGMLTESTCTFKDVFPAVPFAANIRPWLVSR
jgi:hypothetical protein